MLPSAVLLVSGRSLPVALSSPAAKAPSFLGDFLLDFLEKKHPIYEDKRASLYMCACSCRKCHAFVKYSLSLSLRSSTSKTLPRNYSSTRNLRASRFLDPRDSQSVRRTALPGNSESKLTRICEVIGVGVFYFTPAPPCLSIYFYANTAFMGVKCYALFGFGFGLLGFKYLQSISDMFRHNNTKCILIMVLTP